MRKDQSDRAYLIYKYIYMVDILQITCYTRTYDFYMCIPETSTKHEAHIIRMIRLHEAGSSVLVYLCTMYKLVHVNRSTCV